MIEPPKTRLGIRLYTVVFAAGMVAVLACIPWLLADVYQTPLWWALAVAGTLLALILIRMIFVRGMPWVKRAARK